MNHCTKLQILIVSDHYPPFIGGAHRQTQLLGQELLQRGHAVSVVTAWQPGLPAEQDDDGVTVYRLKELRTLLPWLMRDGQQRHHPPYPDPVTAWGLRRLIARLQPDVVHAHGWFSYSCALALVGKDIPLLVSTRDYGYSCATRTLLYREKPCSGPAPLKCTECAAHFYGVPKGPVAALGVLNTRRLLLHKVKGIHSVSAYVQSIMQRDFLRSGNRSVKNDGSPVAMNVISSFLITAHDAPDEKLLSALPDQPYILFVGGLQLRKGLGALLAAYQHLDGAPPLVLIGYEAQDTPKSFPPGITVLRNASHPTVMAAWQRALFGVTPSLWPDPSPGVVREAMSMGKAVIGTNVGGTTEIIVDGKTGLLVPPDDVDALAAAMRKLIAQPELCAQFGRAGQERAKEFRAEVSVPRFEQFYTQLVKSAKGALDQPQRLSMTSK